MTDQRPAPPSRSRRLTATLATTALAATTLVTGVLVAPATASVVAEPVRHAADDAAVRLTPVGTYATGLFDQASAEIVVHHAATQRLLVVNAESGQVDVLDASDPTAPTKVGTISVAGVVDAGGTTIPAGAAVNSVAVRADGLVAVAVEHATKTERGWVAFADATTLAVLGAVRAGALPDKVSISPDGAWAVSADEGEPADDYSTDPAGSVTVVALPGTVTAPGQDAVRTAGFAAYDADGALPEGVRVFGPVGPGYPPVLPSLNLEPEYVEVVGGTAYVTLQEADAIATVDLASATVTDLRALGTQDHGDVALDPSDRDGGVALRTFEGLRGMYQPDAITSYEAGGTTYLVTANEGDVREWGDYVESARVKDLGKDGLAPLCAPLTGLKGDADLGRLNVSTASGLSEDGTCYAELHAFGSRSFSIWSTDGTLVYDSGTSFEEVTAAAAPGAFNSNHTVTNLEGRSDDKGPEPEAVAVGEVGGRTYAFVGFERVGGVAVYDVTDPTDVAYVSYVNNRDLSVSVEDGGDLAAAGDLGPESIAFIAAEDSPTGSPMIAVGNEVSGTTTLFAVETDDTVELQLLGINDFHGRIEAGSGGVAGAAVLAGAVDELRARSPATVFVSAGDNVGASTFTSFIAQDQPTIDALNAAGLEVTAVGNHELDGGFDDLVDRIAPASDYPHLGANVYRAGTDEPALPEYEVVERDGVRIGFVGVVTEQTATLVSPAGIAGITFGDPVEALDRVAARLHAEDLADVVVALVHDGAESNACEDVEAADDAFGRLVRETSADVDAIFSGHTHRAYACTFDVEGSDVPRPVVQGGQYGTHLAQVGLTWDASAGELVAASADVLPLVVDGAPAYPADPDVQAVVDAAVADAEEAGAVEVGSITADITRATTADGAEDRGAESSLGNLVADVQLWATSEDNPAYGGEPADVAVMNPGGLRADLRFGEDGTLTYRDVAAVQPFANTLVVAELTGEQLVDVLEEQWQPDGATRPKLHLGVSANLRYEYVVDAPRGEHVVSVEVDGAPVDPDATYRVAVNSFLASGGDAFSTFTQAASRTDSGQVDLAATVAYVQAHSPVEPASTGRAVVTVGGDDDGSPTPSPTPAPTAPDAGAGWVTIDLGAVEVRRGGELRADLTGLEPGQRVTVTARSTPTAIGTFTADADGQVLVRWRVPADFPLGEHTLEVTSQGLDAASATFEVLAASGPGGSLASTGATVLVALLTALGLLGAGGGILWWRRRAAAA